MNVKQSASARPAPNRGLRFLAAGVALALALLPSLYSCSRQKTEAKAPAAAAQPARPAPVPSQAAAAKPPLPPAPAKAPMAPLAAPLRAFGLRAPSSPRIASDFSLGPLQSFRPPADGDEAAILAVARSFMDGLAAGKLDSKILLPEARDALTVLLAPSPKTDDAAGKEGAAPAYRLGAISISGEDASLKARLPSVSGDAARRDGLLSLRKVDGSWYIETLALDPPATGALVFDPSEGGH